MNGKRYSKESLLATLSNVKDDKRREDREVETLCLKSEKCPFCFVGKKKAKKLRSFKKEWQCCFVFPTNKNKVCGSCEVQLQSFLTLLPSRIDLILVLNTIDFFVGLIVYKIC